MDSWDKEKAHGERTAVSMGGPQQRRPGCVYCAVGHPRLLKPDGVFHDVAVDEGFRLHACTNP